MMTSNLGAEHFLAGMVGKSSMKIARERVMEEVRKHFRPKLPKRLCEVVMFDPLSHKQVARLQMKGVAVPLAERGVALAVTVAVWDIVLSESLYLEGCNGSSFPQGQPPLPNLKQFYVKSIKRS